MCSFLFHTIETFYTQMNQKLKIEMYLSRRAQLYFLQVYHEIQLIERVN